MKCYYHPENEAIALCKSCSRALCRECCSDVPPGTACKDRCEKEVQEVNLVIQRSKSAYEKTGSAYRRNAYWLLVMGSIFTIIGVLPVVMGEGYASIFLALLGVVFIFGAMSNFKNSREISSPVIQNQSE